MSLSFSPIPSQLALNAAIDSSVRNKDLVVAFTIKRLLSLSERSSFKKATALGCLL